MDKLSWKHSPFVFFLLVVGITVRVFAALQVDMEPTGDREVLFSVLGDELKSSFNYSLEGHPTAVVMPVYPLLLGASRWVFPETWTPIRLLQAVLGGLTAWLVYRIAWRISRLEMVAWGTLLLCLFYPPLILLSLKIEPGVVYAFVMALGIWFLSYVLTPSSHLVYFMMAAVLFMAGIYITPRILVIVPLLALWAGLKAYDKVTGFLGAVALCLACILCLMPWMARNSLSLGGFIPLTTGFVVPLQESLVEAGAPKVVETTAARGQDEAIQYHGAVKGLFNQLKGSGMKVWGNVILRGFPFWITTYPGLLPGSGVGPPIGRASALESSMFYRGMCLTITLSLLLLAGVGIAAACFNLSAWMLLALLFLLTFVDTLLANPSYDHLAYWPYFSIFVAWGGWILFAWILAPLWRRREEQTRPYQEDIPPLTPVQTPPGRLDPIQQRHIPKVDKYHDVPKDDDKLGPIF